MKKTLLALSLVLFAFAGFSQNNDIPPKNFTAFYQWNDGSYGTRLIWEKDQSVNMSLNRYHIFRADDPNQLKEIAYQVNVPYNYHYEYFDERVLPGEYYYMVSAEYNDGTICCSDTLAVQVTSTLETTEAITLYPNPTKGQITIHADNMTELRILNSIGQTIYLGEIQDPVFTTDLSVYGKGLYIVQLQTENRLINTKVVVE